MNRTDILKLIESENDTVKIIREADGTYTGIVYPPITGQETGRVQANTERGVRALIVQFAYMG